MTEQATEKAGQAAERLRSAVGEEFAIHDTDWTDEDPDIPEDRPCYRCGKNPADGFASIWTAKTGERWYCHGDDEPVTCYEGAEMVRRIKADDGTRHELFDVAAEFGIDLSTPPGVSE